MRSTPRRVWTADWIAVSSGVPAPAFRRCLRIRLRSSPAPPHRSARPREKGDCAAEGPGRPHVRIKVERLTHLNQRRKGNAIGRSPGPAGAPGRIASKPQRISGTAGAPAMTVVVGHAQVRTLTVEMKPAATRLGMLPAPGAQRPDFRPDSAGRVDCDSIGFQVRVPVSFSIWKRGPFSSSASTDCCPPPPTPYGKLSLDISLRLCVRLRYHVIYRKERVYGIKKISF